MKQLLIWIITSFQTTLILSAQSDTIGYFEDTKIVAYKGKICNNKPCGNWTIFCKSGKPHFEVRLAEEEYQVNYYDARTGKIFQTISLTKSKIDSVEDKKKIKFIERYLFPTISPFIYSKTCSWEDLQFPHFEFSSTYFDEGYYAAYYPNGQNRYKAILKDGKLNGTFKEYYQTGTLYCEGRFRDNQKIGTWKYYYENSQLMSKGEYLRLVIYEQFPGKDSLIIRNDYDKVEVVKAGKDWTEFAMQSNKADKYLIYMAQETQLNDNWKKESFTNFGSFIGTYLKKGKWEVYDEQGNRTIVHYIDGIKVETN
jgi:antitoxin component YwqK of YwqJK toxin-antitoxin module